MTEVIFEWEFKSRNHKIKKFQFGISIPYGERYDHDRLLSTAFKVARVHAEKRFEAVKDAILTLNKINLVSVQAS